MRRHEVAIRGTRTLRARVACQGKYGRAVEKVFTLNKPTLIGGTSSVDHHQEVIPVPASPLESVPLDSNSRR